MGKLNEIQQEVKQSWGDNSFTTTIKDDTVEFDSLKDKFTFADAVEVPSLSINGEPVGPAEPQQQADWNQDDTEAVDYIKNKPTIPDVPLVWNSNNSTLYTKTTSTDPIVNGGNMTLIIGNPQSDSFSGGNHIVISAPQSSSLKTNGSNNIVATIGSSTEAMSSNNILFDAYGSNKISSTGGYNAVLITSYGSTISGEKNVIIGYCSNASINSKENVVIKSSPSIASQANGNISIGGSDTFNSSASSNISIGSTSNNTFTSNSSIALGMSMGNTLGNNCLAVNSSGNTLSGTGIYSFGGGGNNVPSTVSSVFLFGIGSKTTGYESNTAYMQNANMSGIITLGTLKLKDDSGVLKVSDDGGTTWKTVSVS